MKTPPSPRSGSTAAFTLIELMVSMFVLTLLLIMVTQMMNSAIALSSNSTKRLDADSEARLALDRMALDFSQIVKRPDVDYYLQKNGTGIPGANDQMAFYSETGGYFPSSVTSFSAKSNAALVGYRINNHQLERLNKALIWNGVASGVNSSTPLSMTFLPQTLGQAWPAVLGSGTDIDYQVIGEQVFRMETCYLVRNSTTAAVTLSDKPYSSTAAAAVPPSVAPLPANVSPYNGLRDVIACVVTLAVLDSQSRSIVRPEDLDAAAAKLDDVSGTTIATTPGQLWQKHIDHGDLIASSGSPGLAKTAASQVRVYERYFYLGNAQ